MLIVIITLEWYSKNIEECGKNSYFLNLYQLYIHVCQYNYFNYIKRDSLIVLKNITRFQESSL